MDEQSKCVFDHDRFPIALRSEYSIMTKNSIYGNKGYNSPCTIECCGLCTALSSSEKENRSTQTIDVETCAGLKLYALILLRLWRKTNANLKEVQAAMNNMKRNVSNC